MRPLRSSTASSRLVLALFKISQLTLQAFVSTAIVHIIEAGSEEAAQLEASQCMGVED
jgi:hypothetical protein